MSSPTTSASTMIVSTSSERIEDAARTLSRRLARVRVNLSDRVLCPPSGGAVGRTLGVDGLGVSWGDRTLVMAILNLTPDSFSGDGLCGSDVPTEAALEAARSALDAGADILDIGGESTRPGADAVTAAEEIRRVVPAIEAIRAHHPAAVISIDTSKAEVAERALDAGATVVNDVWAMRADRAMAPLVARRGAAIVLMHNRSTPRNTATDAIAGGYYDAVLYDGDDVVGAVLAGLQAAVQRALEAGIERDRIIVDPGIGFGKTPAQNLELLDRVSEIRALGFPALVGPSRKSFIGLTLDLPPDDRVEGTAAAVAVAIARGADIVRVHDVRAMTRVARMTDAIVRR